ncbi:sulfotransferase family protein [Rhodococcus artemisiae]|uniref:Sulfotransferase n=1 Tax=Rhodococcus artemisiae TaxID=714159 RepID=A0ABU7L5U1_9NOCA|nr:sulfotransferase [Rhodococcus artemisiae]MEE2056911.1 sulfotransferase [Rhodococcus artemisiae]
MFDIGEMLETATLRTDLTDFGDDSFREGLDILLSSLRSEAQLNSRGESFLHERIVNHLAQRLQVEDWYRRHPEIESEQITAPLIGLGLPRTGSTALSLLLAQDPGVRYIRRWESSQPCPPTSTVVGVDPRIPSDMGEKVGSRHHVPVDTHGPMECHDLMALDFKSYMFLSFAQIPTYAEWLVTDADLTSTFEYQRRVMKLMQWGEPSRPWRLKCPTHVLFLDAIDKVFPDARFVMTHRDPTDCMLSVSELIADIIMSFTDSVDKPFIGRTNVEHWVLGMQRALEFRAAGADERFYDIDFRAMQAEPIGRIEGLYRWLGEPVTEQFETQMRDWWMRAAAEREPSKSADPVEFGIVLEQVRPRFAEYLEKANTWTVHEFS